VLLADITLLRSTRFIVFDEHAKIITEHQTEFDQILPHAGWHEQDPVALVDAMRECINRATRKMESQGWSQDSVKGIGACRWKWKAKG
jgi:glycerol kinase